MKVTVGIKALNEEDKIAACLESALAAIGAMDGEVILADSGSTDRTVEIASRYPVRIVQLENASDRGCGAGAQLAFQFAQGEYFYLLDGDMTLDPDFLIAGIAYLEAHENVAAVGGWITEQNLDGHEFQVRADKARHFEGAVDCLDCGGLYRTSAIQKVYWFADRNLHAFEEFDLGMRLGAAGWKLVRLDRPGVNHFGHVTDGYRLLIRRMKSGYSRGLGEIVRGAIGRPHFLLLLRRLKALRMVMIVIGWWTILAALLLTGHGIFTLALLIAPLAGLMLRRRSVSLGAYSFAACNFMAVGFLSGLFGSRVPPETALAARQIAAYSDMEVMDAYADRG